MKALDLTRQLKAIIPRYTDLFSDSVLISSVTRSGTVVIDGVTYYIVTCVTTAAHGLSVEDEVYVNNVITPITISSLTRVGNVATAITNSNHDYTDNYTQTVTITGADQAAYNGAHMFIHQPNRRTFQFTVTGDPVTPATGTIKTLNNLKHGYNGLHRVYGVTNTTTFTYLITSQPESPAIVTNAFIQAGMRIGSTITLDRAVENYTKQAASKMWMYIVLGETFASKDRNLQYDGTSFIVPGQDVRTRISEPFSVYVFAPTSNDLSASYNRDLMQDIFRYILKAIFRLHIPSNFSDATNFAIGFVNHEVRAYEYAYYIHEFKFENVFDLVYEDGVDTDDSVAFRDLYFNFNNKNNVQIMSTQENLDDNPL